MVALLPVVALPPLPGVVLPLVGLPLRAAMALLLAALPLGAAQQVALPLRVPPQMALQAAPLPPLATLAGSATTGVCQVAVFWATLQQHQQLRKEPGKCMLGCGSRVMLTLTADPRASRFCGQSFYNSTN